MARINFEECWWSDPRRMKLVVKLGSGALADGVASNAWRVAQEFWKDAKGLVPKHIFDSLEHAAALVEVGLADVRGCSVYVRGSSARLDWVREKKEQASLAGKKSAEVRRKKNGSAQPKGGKQDQKSGRESNENRTDGNGIEPSDSGSVSDSVLVVPKNNNNEPNGPAIHDLSYQTENLNALGEILNQAFGKERPKYLNRALPKILHAFGDPGAFAVWVEGVINAKNCPDPDRDFASFTRYFSKSINSVLEGRP